VGIEPNFRKPSLSFGSIVHRGLEHLYLSGCRDGEDTGEYLIEPALEAARLEHLKIRGRYESDDQAEEDWLSIQAMLRAYYDRFGPKSPSPDWPNIRVIHDDQGKPIIERELWTELGTSGRFYSVRIDTLISYFGMLQEFQHKTSAPGMWLNDRLRGIHTDSQMTGTSYVLAKEFPELLLDGIRANILIKGNGPDARNKVAVREKTTRTREDHDAFEAASLSVLRQIDEAVGGFDRDLEAGRPFDYCVNYWFPDHGQRTQYCQAYRGCTFLQLCHRKGAESEELRMFRPRVLDSGPQVEVD
jgi:hypothetical protein